MPKASEKELFLDISQECFIQTDGNANIVYANKAALENFGNQIIGQKISFVMGADNFEKFQEYMYSVNFPKQAFLFWKNEKFYEMRKTDNNSSHFFILKDKTKDYELSYELTRVSEKLTFAEKIAKLGFWELDLTSKKIYASPQIFNIFGMSVEATASKKNFIRESIVEEDVPFYKQKLKELINQKKNVEGEIRIRRPDGRLRYCYFRARIIYNRKKSRIVGVFQDLTHVIEVRQTLIKAKELAENLNKAKSHFLAQASHDLRQPMQALGLFISALSEEKLTHHQNNIMSKIESSAESLKSLLDNVLDLSRLESNEEIIDNKEFEINILLQSLSDEFHAISQNKNISFKFVNHRARVYTDSFLLERLLRNLLNNAVKFTKNKILFGAKWQQDMLQIFVIDNGIGIKEDELEKIFDEFYQSDSIENNRELGTGLGLSIVKKIADILHVQIGANSQVGKGSCFYISLPAQKI